MMRARGDEMLHARVSAFLSILVILGAAGAHGQSNLDGDFWKIKNRDLKLVYVTGFVDGRNEGLNAAAGALGTNISNPKIAKLASEVTVGQIVDGLDEFYKDYRNARILMRHAIEYVLMEAQGEDGSQLLQYMRKQAAQPKQR
jgi:hypothetical protein